MAVKKRPAKIASKKKANAGKVCPTCDKEMTVVKMVRHSAPSGMLWRCEKGHELPTS